MSYVADPPDDPIDIDGAIEYIYVIAQQGALSMSVDADADFTFVPSFGSPATLRLTFIGATDTVPIYKTVTIRIGVPEGEIVHTPNFRILPTSGSQRVPNITNASGMAVAPGATVRLRIATDIAADSFTATGLPGGLLVTSDGRITGGAPPESGFNVFTLAATIGAYTYKRYFILTVGTGGSPIAQPFFRFPDL